jgi:hypothetical protein
MKNGYWDLTGGRNTTNTCARVVPRSISHVNEIGNYATPKPEGVSVRSKDLTTYNFTISPREVTTIHSKDSFNRLNCRGATGSRDTETNLGCKAGSLVHIAHENFRQLRH